MAATNMYPCFKNTFKVGAASATATNSIAGMSTFSPSFDGKVEEWTNYEDEGWTRHYMTGKTLTISLKGKRVVGDAGNDFIADMASKTGADCDGKFEWVFPSGAKLAFDCTFDVKNIGGGESEGLDSLEFDVKSNGKPTYTPAAAG